MSDKLGCGFGAPELDQILIPGVAGSYETHSLLTLMGFSSRALRSYSGFGLAPLHFITQRSPAQDGESVLDMRYDVRTIQIVISETLAIRTGFWDRRWDLLDMLRPNRSFGDTVQPLIYRKWLPAGKIEQGTDMSVVNGSNTVTSHDGRFVDRGGLDPGVAITIGGVGYVVGAVPNDYTLTLTAVYAGATADDVAWSYRRGWARRDLYCLLEFGPNFDEGPGSPPAWPQGYREALRFVAHDPFWYSPVEQTETWEIPDEFGDLVFDGSGAWLGATPGVGRWLFLTGFVGETTSVTYWGTQGAKPIIEIDGPAINPTVANDTTGASITMTYTVALNETVTINTLAQTVTNNAGVNLMPYTGGDVATFSLEPHPQAPNRNNSVNISFGGGVQGQSAARLTWQSRYVGV